MLTLSLLHLNEQCTDLLVRAKNHSQPYVAEYLLGESEDPETHDVELLRSTYLAASCYLENSDRGLRRIFYQATSKDDARPSLHMVQINGSQNIKQGSGKFSTFSASSPSSSSLSVLSDHAITMKCD